MKRSFTRTALILVASALMTHLNADAAVKKPVKNKEEAIAFTLGTFSINIFARRLLRDRCRTASLTQDYAKADRFFRAPPVKAP